jgi:hypothetical protein
MKRIAPANQLGSTSTVELTIGRGSGKTEIPLLI